MPEVQHELAVYYDDAGMRCTVRAEHLKNNVVLADAKKRQLFDPTEQIRLVPRAPDGVTPHFYEVPSNSKARKVFEGEKDPTHDARVSNLVGDLNTLKPFRLILKERGDEGVRELFRLPDYNWGLEVHRILSATTIVRHDVFGQSQDLSMSVYRPWIAIEVIHTHFPEEEAFAGFLELSKNVPLLVLFDFTAKPNTFLRVYSQDGILQIRPWTYYIWSGQVWQGQDVTKIHCATRFEVEAKRALSQWK